MNKEIRPIPHPATLWLQSYCLPTQDVAEISRENISLRRADGKIVETKELFLGADPFMPWHHSVFNGRSTQTKHVIDLIDKHSFVAVLGGSGTGKSSLVFAGVLPILLSRDTGRVPAQWVPVVFKPDVSPRTNLASNLASWFEKLTSHISGQYPHILLEKQVNWYDRILQHLDEPGGLVDVIDLFHARIDKALRNHSDRKDNSRPIRYKFLLVIDQFEESFTQTPKDERTVFFERLREKLPAYASDDEMDTPFAILLSMRSEYLESCQEYAPLLEAINEALYILPAMGNSEVVNALSHSFSNTERSPVEPSLRYKMDESLEGWLKGELEKWQSEQDALALVQVVLRTLWMEALTSDLATAFPLTQRHVVALAEVIGVSPEKITLDQLFQGILNDTLSDTPRLAACNKKAIDSKARIAFKLAYPFCGSCDIAFMKFSKRSFRASDVYSRLKDPLYRFLNWGRGINRFGALSTVQEITSQLELLCQVETKEKKLLPVLRKIGSSADGDGVFELCHEAFIRRYLPLYDEVKSIGDRAAYAEKFARGAEERTITKWGRYLRNAFSVSTPRLLIADRAVLKLIAERAQRSLQRAKSNDEINGHILRQSALASGLIQIIIMVGLPLALGPVAKGFVEFRRLEYYRNIQALNHPLVDSLRKEIEIEYDPRPATDVIKLFAIMDGDLPKIANSDFISDNLDPNNGYQYVVQMHTRGKLAWSSKTSSKVIKNDRPNAILLVSAVGNDIALMYKGQLIGRYDTTNAGLDTKPISGPINNACEAGINRYPRAEFAFMILRGRKENGVSVLSADWWIALDSERLYRIDGIKLPDSLQKFDTIGSLVAAACLTPAGEVQGITISIEYELNGVPAGEQKQFRKFLAFVDPSESFNSLKDQSTPPKYARESAQGIYSSVRKFCGAAEVKSNDTSKKVLAKFKDCLTPDKVQ